MASSTPTAAATTPDTPITIKITYNGSVRKFKLPLRELNVNDFSEAKVRSLLGVPEGQKITLERFSDSSGAYLSLDPSNPSAYKQLYRAAKAKLKLRIQASIVEQDLPKPEVSSTAKTEETAAKEPALPNVVEPKGPSNLWPLTGTGASARTQFFDQLGNMSRERELGLRMKEAPTPAAATASPWQVFCNSCDKLVADFHFHCSVCDGGDYDLCEACVRAGKFCPGEDHLLIKRSIVNGKMITSTTEKLPPKPKLESEKQMPGSFKTEAKPEPVLPEPTRTCNACVIVLPEKMLVTCDDCDDYDLCVSCHNENKHGHHPGHSFRPLNKNAAISAQGLSMCAPGRNIRHHAICDGCNNTIYGVRHKCLNCPDWDFCNKCVVDSAKSHAGHRFAPIYGPLECASNYGGIHFGIFCDGPLCSGKANQTYIRGIRYKCAICNDTDFCANCEAHPTNQHNITHPLIKFKTQVRNVSVTTLGENGNGESLGTMGDLNSATTSPGLSRAPVAAAGYTAVPSPPPYSQQAPHAAPVNSSELDAHFLRDAVVDGTKFPSNWPFVQVWVLRNPGPHPWPAGCSVRQVGGDNMLNVDHTHPATVNALNRAKSSNSTPSVTDVGDEFHFRVRMRTPVYPGKYISHWRLKAPDGTAFGHKLWCDVEVRPNMVPPSPLMGQPNSWGQPHAAGTSPVRAHGTVPFSGGALSDYQMQLMLLEQQNKKRLMLARGEHHHPPAAAPAAAPHSSSNPAGDTVETQLAARVRAAKELQQKVQKAQKEAQEKGNGTQLDFSGLEEQIGKMDRQIVQMTKGLEEASRKFTPEELRERMRAAWKTTNSPHTAAEATVSTEKTEQPLEKETDVSVNEQVVDEKPESSTMVFPKLEKESPESSIHDAASLAAPTPADERPLSSAATETETVTTTHEETFEDAEELDLDDSDDDDFMTDEEYDILDASDEEIVNDGTTKST